MKYLAWDTSSATGVVTAFEDGKEIVSWSLSLETSRHSERLLWSIDTVLQSAGWRLKDLDAIAVGVGPGSFTGLRIGVTTAKMLAHTLSIPLIPISSLALLAKNATNIISKEESVLVIACTDATKGEWFHLIGEALEENEAVLAPEAIIEKIQIQLQAMGPSAKWIAIGQSVERYPEIWLALPQTNRILDLPSSIHRVHPANLTELAQEAIQAKVLRPAALVTPRYLRDSEAEVKLKKGLLKLNPLASNILRTR
jgi:tRNA threonylcarbamoyladenosine biosynthesis protein TsaB